MIAVLERRSPTKCQFSILWICTRLKIDDLSAHDFIRFPAEIARLDAALHTTRYADTRCKPIMYGCMRVSPYVSS